MRYERYSEKSMHGKRSSGNEALARRGVTPQCDKQAMDVRTIDGTPYWLPLYDSLSPTRQEAVDAQGVVLG